LGVSSFIAARPSLASCSNPGTRRRLGGAQRRQLHEQSHHEKRGKGSHVTLYFGDRLTVVRNPKDELKTVTLHAMCKQLGIGKDEL
jgi:predicted RNA binding protein YcfA (HicA-like mRNA interferase family)